MDSDIFPLINTEELFSIELNQVSTTNPPFSYSFAAAPNLVEKNKDGVFIIGVGFNAGLFILKPDVTVFDRLWARALTPGHPWNMHHDMEQGLLNDFFATAGEAPMHQLHWSWNVKDMPDEYISESKIVHAR
jgi:alpha-N-acetylglucosamine transferase